MVYRFTSQKWVDLSMAMLNNHVVIINDLIIVMAKRQKRITCDIWLYIEYVFHQDDICAEISGIDPQDMGNVNDDEVSGFSGALISDKAHGV